jgi:hypothetical protein
MISNEVKLQGRIYPALRSCVGNRYKIVLGLFAYYGFLLSTSSEIARRIYEYYISLGFSIVMGLFTIHNTANYLLNRYERIKLEGDSLKYSWKKPNTWPLIEFISFILIVGLILFSYLVIGKNYDC